MPLSFKINFRKNKSNIPISDTNMNFKHKTLLNKHCINKTFDEKLTQKMFNNSKMCKYTLIKFQLCIYEN